MTDEKDGPSDDELELAQVIKDFWWECEAGQKPTPGQSGYPSAGDVALASHVLAAGFRRTEVLGLNAEEVAAEHQRHADARRAETMTLISHAEPLLDPKPWIVRGYFGDYIGRTASVDPLTKGDHAFKPRPEYEQDRAVYDAAEIEVPEPQGEPSDAVLDAAMQAAKEYAEADPHATNDRELLRVALCAAWRVQ